MPGEEQAGLHTGGKKLKRNPWKVTNNIFLAILAYFVIFSISWRRLSVWLQIDVHKTGKRNKYTHTKRIKIYVDKKCVVHKTKLEAILFCDLFQDEEAELNLTENEA